ncbi:hypothetical protein C8R45DRAFT_1047613 [Mycena sanguinolenta]|nr:hypothetical protein C8R45DRAFT_1047613 [Mycena sanguinolenta]
MTMAKGWDHCWRALARQLHGAPPRLPQSRTVLDRVGAPPPPLSPRWRGRGEARAGEEKEKISRHSLPERADVARSWFLRRPRMSERVVLRVASDAEPQGCDYFLHRDSRPVVHVYRATTIRPAATTATTAARCAWGDDEVIMKIGRGRGSGLEANARVEVSCFPFPGALFPVSVSPALLFVFLPPLRACV